MLTILDTFTLPNNKRAALYHATCPLPPDAGAKLGYFLEMIWGGYDKPDLFVVATLKGWYEADSRNDFVWVEVEGEVVSTAWTITPPDDPRVGGLGEVFTVESLRGLGLAKRTCAAILNIFDGRGGRCMFLGTDNPSAARVYEGLGFRPYPDKLYRRLTPPDADFEAEWFAPGDVTFRELVWGDSPRLTTLYGARGTWVSVCAPQGYFSVDYVRHGRANSFIKYTWQSTRAGLWLGMFSAGGALVGSCPVYPRGNERDLIGGEIDLYVHPSFVGQAADLLDAARERLKARGWRWWMAQLPASDGEKIAVLERGGFTRIATLPDALSIDGATQDVVILHGRL